MTDADERADLEPDAGTLAEEAYARCLREGHVEEADTCRRCGASLVEDDPDE